MVHTVGGVCKRYTIKTSKHIGQVEESKIKKMYSQQPFRSRCDIEPAWRTGLYTPQDHLFYSLVRVLILQAENRLGLLNPYAAPFYPQEIKDMNNNGQNESNGKAEKDVHTKLHSQKPSKLTKNVENTDTKHKTTNKTPNYTKYASKKTYHKTNATAKKESQK